MLCVLNMGCKKGDYFINFFKGLYLRLFCKLFISNNLHHLQHSA